MAEMDQLWNYWAHGAHTVEEMRNINFVELIHAYEWEQRILCTWVLGTYYDHFGLANPWIDVTNIVERSSLSHDDA